MSKRRKLLIAVRAMFGILLFAFLYVLLSAADDDSDQDIPRPDSFDGLTLGQTVLRRHRGQRVWVTYLSPAQRQQAESLATYVKAPMEGCRLSQQYCVLSAATTSAGIEISYSDTPPARLSSKVPWFGGFVNPKSGAVYDRLGRLYLSSTGPASLTVIPSS